MIQKALKIIALCVVCIKPAYSDCGTWQQSYTMLYNRILTGDMQPRYAVFVAVEAGLADNLLGLITSMLLSDLSANSSIYPRSTGDVAADHTPFRTNRVFMYWTCTFSAEWLSGIYAGFYYALLSNRAFQIYTYGNLPDLHDAYDFPHINITRHIRDPEHLTAPARFSYKGQRKYDMSVNASKYYSAYLINDDEKNQMFATKNLRLWPRNGDVETVFIGSNRGRVISLFENPYHASALYDMGLRPDTAFACGFRYLFEPNAAVKSEFGPSMNALMKPPTALRIGIKVRAGDDVFLGKEFDLSFIQGYITCAEEIEKSRKQIGQESKW